VDISSQALESAAHLLADRRAFTVRTFQCSYEDGIEEAITREPGGRVIVLLLGSNIGNFDEAAADALLRGVRHLLQAGDLLLLGADLVKPVRELILAYDDPLGVTAAFNKNLLVRINRELGGHFDVAAFRHRAIWNAALSRMEMYLVASRPQRVRIDAIDLDIDLAAGESIWTESSYKYEPDEIVTLVEGAGFRKACQWIEAADPFTLTLFEAV
jgi:uncharacterized SAM-dependent methyltransferase